MNSNTIKLVHLAIVVSVVTTSGCQHFLQRCRQRFHREEIIVEDVAPPHGSGYLKAGPTVEGQLLGTAPPTATERALELQEEVDELRSSYDQLRHQVLEVRDALQERERQIEDRDHALGKVEGELVQASKELAAAKDALRRWEDETNRLQGQLEVSEQRQLSTMDELATTLSELIQRYEATTAGDTTTSPQARPSSPLPAPQSSATEETVDVP